MPLLESAFFSCCVGDPSFCQIASSLADAHEEQGNLLGAVGALEESSAGRMRTWGYHGSVGVFWLENQWRLAKLYRRLGQMDRAREVEDDLTRILARADADHPVLLDLQRLEAMGARKTDAN